MLKIKRFSFNPVMVNSYVVSDETKEAVIIDCGCASQSEWNELISYIQSEGLSVKHLLNTHLHFDHVWGNPFAHEALGLSPEASKADLPVYNNIEQMLERMFGVRIPVPSMPELGRDLKDGDEVKFGNTTFAVILTPGHSLGSLCFYDQADETLFSGDTLFCGSIGRTDLEGGNHYSIMESLQRLAILPDSTKVYSGHGESTTIANEKRYNPYL